MVKPGRERWVLAMSDPEAARQISENLPEHIEPYVSLAGDEALSRVRQLMPEVLVTDLTLPGLDGPELIRRVRAAKLFTLPFALVMAVTGLEKYERWAKDEGACRFLVKPVGACALAHEVSLLTPADRLTRLDVDNQSILRSLWALGFSARMRGTKYLATAIELASRDVRLIKQLTTVLYPMVAKQHAVDEQRVEHALRRAIESAWSVGSLETQYKLFGNTIDAKRGKPTAGEMIACMAELLRSGMEMDE